MKRLIHISDLHFGRSRVEVVRSLSKSILSTAPDLVIVSGDLTQRARPHEFKQAREFLQDLSCNKIVVPGNHDIPLFNVYERFFFPYRRYCQLLSDKLNPFYEDTDLSILGLTTAHSWTVSGAKIHRRSLWALRNSWKNIDGKTKVIVAHHPFNDLPEAEIFGAGPDILLTGHCHKTAISLQKSLIIVEAGSAVSNRLRGEVNSFNSLLIEDGRVDIETFGYEENLAQFVPITRRSFRQTKNGWQEVY